jgi:hypothetical protein
MKETAGCRIGCFMERDRLLDFGARPGSSALPTSSHALMGPSVKSVESVACGRIYFGWRMRTPAALNWLLYRSLREEKYSS